MKYLIEVQYTTSSGDFGYEYIDTMSIECDDITQFFEEAIKDIGPTWSLLNETLKPIYNQLSTDFRVVAPK